MHSNGGICKNVECKIMKNVKMYMKRYEINGDMKS
jgi:hypothetical protein